MKINLKTNPIIGRITNQDGDTFNLGLGYYYRFISKMYSGDIDRNNSYQLVKIFRDKDNVLKFLHTDHSTSNLYFNGESGDVVRDFRPATEGEIEKYKEYENFHKNKKS